MAILDNLLGLLQRWTKKPEDDLLVTLVQLGLEDTVIRRQMLSILSLPQHERTSRLTRWRKELATEGAPAELTNILMRLEEESIANQTLLILQRAETSNSVTKP